ncbi:hypothetical protein [Plantactinospora sp. GCM10030261]|uniref:hypothetical protein n=1 Tax=Plantactinospora sp. GCM10030261 TaxID=3273420 RepID=UPI00361E116E
MDGQARQRSRDLVRRAVRAALGDEVGVVADASDARVRWWSPADPDWVHGPESVDRALRGLLAGEPVDDAVDALVVSEDGTTAVVELGSRPVPGGVTTPVTLVIELAAGRITEGRGYLDLPPDGGGADGARSDR